MTITVPEVDFARTPDLATDQRPPRSRLGGVDVARSLAMLGMLLEHELQYPALQHKDALWSVYGRSAPLFVLLAGIGLSLADHPHWRENRRTILARVPMLLLLGMALTLGGDGVILQSFALFFLIGACATRLPRWLLGGAGGGCLVGGPLFLTLLRRHNEIMGFGSQRDIGFHALLDPVGFGRGMVLSYYPAVIWMGFFFVGMALGRCDLSEAAVGRRLFGWSVVASTVLYTVGWAGARAFAPYTGAFALAPDPPMTWSQHWTTYGFSSSVGWALSSTAVALAVVGGCIWAWAWAVASAHLRARFLASLAALGAVPLTFYVLHFVYLGTAWAAAEPYLTNPYVLFVASIAFWAASAVAAVAWLGRFRRGPIETVLHVCELVLTGRARRTA